MEAERYLWTKKRLSQAMNGEERLQKVITDITVFLKQYNLDSQPEIAFDVMVFALETMHLEKLRVSEYVR